MKLKYDFVLREIAGDYILIPRYAAALKLSGMITTNEVGAFLWEQLTTETSEESLVNHLMEEYEIDSITAEKDVKEFLDQLYRLNLIEKI